MQRALIFHSPRGRPVPDLITAFSAAQELQIVPIGQPAEVLASVNRSFPACIVFDSTDDASMELVRSLKSDTFCAIVPIIFVLETSAPDAVLGPLEVGADDVISADMNRREAELRLTKMLERADRDVSVHPTTRLPGTALIARDMSERLYSGEKFAVCYADLDHFKEYNDRYGYDQGDRIIRMISRIIRDVVKSRAPTGFIGHIGGDDYIFNVPLEHMTICCEEIIEICDELLPVQYSERDRARGYIIARDRRGTVHRIPLMTLSIGVVTNEKRVFAHPAEINAVATEMKTYAKGLPGSVFAVDRREGPVTPRYAAAEDEELAEEAASL